MNLTILALPTNKLAIPYEINSVLTKEQTPKHRGFLATQTYGFQNLVRTLKLTYLDLTENDLAVFDVFSIQDPYTVFSIQLTQAAPYIIGKPSELTKTPRRKFYQGVISIVWDLSFSARIL